MSLNMAFRVYPGLQRSTQGIGATPTLLTGLWPRQAASVVTPEDLEGACLALDLGVTWKREAQDKTGDAVIYPSVEHVRIYGKQNGT